MERQGVASAGDITGESLDIPRQAVEGFRQHVGAQVDLLARMPGAVQRRREVGDLLEVERPAALSARRQRIAPARGLMTEPCVIQQHAARPYDAAPGARGNGDISQPQKLSRHEPSPAA